MPVTNPTPVRKHASARIVRREDLNAELMKVWLEPDVPFDFKPGQYCTIGMNDIERAYSIASAPHEPYLELYIEKVPQELAEETSLTPPLFDLQEGGVVTLRPRAKGKFIVDPTYDTHVFVATVTGIGPFMSMVRAYLHRTDEQPDGYYGRRFKHIYIFQGASYQDEFGYDPELLALAAEHPDITYRMTVSQIPGQEREPGRNAGWIPNDETRDILRVNRNLLWYFGQYGIQPEGTCVYVCGNEKMIDDLAYGATPMEKALMEKGLDRVPGQLVKLGYEARKEIYF